MSEKKKVFISGPISSKPDTYQAEFSAAAKLVEEAGFIPILPSTLPLGMDPGDYMRISLAMLETSDMVLLLNGWEDSDGANLEAGYADYIKKPCMEMRTFSEKYFAQEPEPIRRPMSRVERMFGARDNWNKEAKDENPSPERPDGYKGFLLIRCPECGAIRGFCTKSYITETTCRSCGAVTQLEKLIPAHVNCGKCGRHFKYQTNIDTKDPVSIHCINCDAPVDLQMNGSGTALVTIGFRRGADNGSSFRTEKKYWLEI